MRSTGTGTPVGVSIRVPDSWYEFDIHPAGRDDNIRQAVNERVRAYPELAPYRPMLLRILRQSARDAWDSGAVYCGCYADALDAETPVTAGLTMAVVDTRRDDGSSLDTDPQAMAKRFPAKQAQNADDTWQRVAVLELPRAGTAVRTEGVEDLPVPGTHRSARMITMQTFVRVPGSPDRVAVITATSPNLPLQDPFLELFDAISATFCFTYA